MSANVETMMYTGEVPWHGLGKAVPEGVSTEAALKLSGLDWTVECRPLFLADGRKVADGKATVRATDNAVLGVVGPGYTPLQNSAAFRFFDRFLAAGAARLETAGSLFDGRKVWILARIVGDPMDVAPGDAVNRYVLLSNSHDGTLAVRVGYVPVRVVCANTLAMAHGHRDAKLVRIMHRERVAEAVEALGETMDAVNRDFKATCEQYRFLASRNVKGADLAKYVRRVFGLVDEERGKRLLARIAPAFEKGRGNDMPGVRGTWWAAFNAVTEYTSHERGKSRETRVDSLWHGEGAKLNARALEVASTMANGLEPELANV